jgi:uncharacterized nucleotidyltransferase DUF6036
VSGREPVGAERVRAFLVALGREFRHPARLYLSGGEGLVLRGLRTSTLDIDVTFEVDPRFHGEWLRLLRDLIVRTATSVEEASPADFIPLPPGAAERAQFVERFGNVDVYLYDPYSVALSKLSRAHAKDLDDVRKLVEAGVVAPAELRRLFEVILPAYELRGVRADPVRFRAALDRVAPPP